MDFVCKTKGLARVVAVAAVVIGLSGPLAAQSQAELSAERDAVFAEMLGAPNDRALMQRYARLSVQMRDFESAAATLERLLDLEPDNRTARFELAVAYFALGSNEVAQYHLAQIRASGPLSPEMAARVALYSDEAEARSRPNRVTGRIALGYGTELESGQSGAVATASVTWRADFGNADAEDWLTQFRLSAFAPGGGGASERQTARLRTGPEFRLTGTAYGPRLQPYLEVAAVRDADGTDYNLVGVGLSYQNPTSARFTHFADLSFGQAEDLTNGGTIDVADLTLGATYRPSRDTRLRLSFSGLMEDGGSADSTRVGARFDAWHEFDAPVFDINRRWALGGYLTADTTEVTGVAARTDDRAGGGMWLRAFVTENAYVETRAARVLRESTLAGFDAEETTVSLMLGWEF